MIKRVALCLSGQVRTYRCCYPSLYENVIAPLNADVFIHTWSKTDRSGDHTTDELALQDLYRPKRMIVEDHDAVSSHFAPPPEYGVWGSQTIDGKAMYYSIYVSNMLATAQGLTDGSPYDLVIRCRFDLRFTRPLAVPVELDHDLVYVPEVSSRHVNDMLAYGSHAAMKNYATCFFYMDQHCATGAETFNEGILLHHVNKMGLTARPSCVGPDHGFELVRRCE